MDARLVLAMALLSTAICLPADKDKSLGRDPEGQCEEFQGLGETNIPSIGDILSIEEFDDSIVNRMYSKFYHVMTKRYWSSPEHFFTKIRKLNDTTYSRDNFGDKIFTNECRRFSHILTKMVPESNKAIFRDNRNRLMTFFSDCPEQYYIRYVCADYVPGQRKCPLKDTIMSIQLPDSAHNIPLHKMAEEIFAVTGVRFGAPDLEWSFVYGRNELCNK